MLKKIFFFYFIFHLVAYAVFLLDFHPSGESKSMDSYTSTWNNNTTTQETYTTNQNFYLIPDYTVLQACPTCDYKEENNFYPFHKFTFGYGDGYWNEYSGKAVRDETKGFVGIFGYYGHTEFVFYVIIPLIIFGLVLFYRKYISPPKI